MLILKTSALQMRTDKTDTKWLLKIVKNGGGSFAHSKNNYIWKRANKQKSLNEYASKIFKLLRPDSHLLLSKRRSFSNILNNSEKNTLPLG